MEKISSQQGLVHSAHKTEIYDDALVDNAVTISYLKVDTVH